MSTNQAGSRGPHPRPPESAGRSSAGAYLPHEVAKGSDGAATKRRHQADHSHHSRVQSGIQSGITSDDFQRLGVHPQECRLTVIRQAAARTSKGLAKKQLQTPSDRAERQLSQVATSAYRLMNPRLRDDSHERVHIGRIMPNTLLWAGRTQFAIGEMEGQRQQESAQDASSTNDAYNPVFDEEPHMGLVDSVMPLATGIDLGNGLTKSLTSDDILGRSWIHRAWLRLRFNSPSRAFFAGMFTPVAIVAVGVTIWWIWFAPTIGPVAEHPQTEQARIDASPIDASPAEEPSIEHAAKTIPTQASNHPVIVDQSSDSSLPKPQAVPGSGLAPPEMESREPLVSAESADAVLPDSLNAGNSDSQPDSIKPDSSSLDSKPVAVQPSETGNGAAGPEMIVPLPDASGSILAPTLSDETPHLEAAADKMPMETSAGEETEFLDDPFASLVKELENGEAIGLLMPDEQPNSSPEVEADGADLESPVTATLQPEDSATEARRSIPDSKAVSELRKRMIGLVPELQSRVQEDEVDAIVKQLQTMGKDIESNSIDEWALRTLLAQVQWLTSGASSTSKTLEPLADHYDVGLESLLATAFIDVPSFQDSERLHIHRFQAGIRLYDRLLVAQHLDLAKSVGKSLKKSTDFLGDSSRMSMLKEFAEAVEQMARLREGASAVVSVPAKVDVRATSTSTAGIGGRYMCLMLRDWNRGLPWLASGSDARLSKLAKEELELQASLAASTPDDREMLSETIELAERWNAAASREKGRAADSMRAHALDLFKQAHDSATGLTKLELQRTIDAALLELPFYLKTTERDSLEPALIAAEKVRGLTGRIREGKRDIGVQLRYEMPTAITNDLVDRIRGAMKEPLSETLVIELAGRFTLESATTLRFTLVRNLGMVSERVLVDGKPIVLNEKQPVAMERFAAGDHVVEWTIRGKHFPKVFLDVRDAQRNRRVEIFGAYQRKPDDVATKLRIDMVHGKR